jgi:hypothetical protein
MFSRRPYVFIVDNHVFSSPNSSTIPPIPSNDRNVSSKSLPGDTLNIHWANSRYPGLAFTPVSPRFYSEPFQCLKPPQNVFPIEGSGWSWRLAQATADSFSALERDLSTIEGALRATPHASLSLPPSYDLFPLPVTYGYNAMHSSEEAAQASAQKSRDAFLPLMGWCSFLMSCFHQHISQGGIDLFRWEVVLRQNRLPLDYIQVIKTSELVDFSTDYARVGTFMGHSDKGFDRYIGHWIKYNVPVWIHWGDVRYKPPVPSEVLRIYFPSDSEVMTAKATASREAARETASTQAASNIPVETGGPTIATNEYPKPEPRSGQKHGETWHQFFARMDEARAKRISHETAKAQQIRLAREAAQAKHPRPGLNSKAPSVFEWEEDVNTGFLLRKAIHRSHAQSIWSTYSKSQRRYDSTTHVWDLCAALDPKSTTVIVGNFYDDSESEDECFGLHQPSPAVPRPPSLLATHGTRSPPISHPSHASQDDISPLESVSAVQHDVVMSSSVPSNPPILTAVRDLSPSMITRQLSSPSPTVPPSNFAAQNDTIMPSSVTSNPPPILSAVHDLSLSVTTRQSSSPPPTVPPPSSAAQNDASMSSSISADPASVTLMATRQSSSPPPTVPPSTPTARNDVIMSSSVPPQSSPSSASMPLPTSPNISAFNERFPSATTWELTTSSPIPLATPGAHEDTLPAPKADPALPRVLPTVMAPAEPGRYEVLYGGPPAPLTSLQFKRTLLDDMYLRYGFISTRVSSRMIYEPKFTWPKVERIFGNVGSDAGNGVQTAVSYFLEMLLDADRPAASLNQHWDLAADSVLPLADHINHRFRLVVQRSAELGTIYFVEEKDRTGDDVPWQLMLTDAATVLECFRHEEATSIGALALFLFQHGRPFSTRIRRSQIQTVSQCRSIPLLVLGWRPKGHRPTVNEYNFYEFCRKSFFDNHPHSRSAHLKGALIWRLALEAAGHLAEECVLDGPSEEVLDRGTCIGSNDSAELLWDDELSKAEMDLICGVYEYATGEFVECIITSYHTQRDQARANRHRIYLGGQSNPLSSFLVSGLVTGHAAARTGFKHATMIFLPAEEI